MRKNALVICCVSCVFGAFGAFLRWIQNLTAFEAGTGLYISGNIFGRLLVALSLALVLVLVALILGYEKKGLLCPEDCTLALGGQHPLYRPAYIACAILLAIGALLILLRARSDKYPTLVMVLSVLGLLGACGFTLLAASTQKKRNPPLNCFGSALLIMLYCFWLILSFRENAATAVIWTYCVEILALCAALLGFYYIAGIPFGRPRPYRAVFFCFFGAYACIVSLPDTRNLLGLTVMLVATICMLLFLGFALVSNLGTEEAIAARSPAPEKPAEEKDPQED